MLVACALVAATALGLASPAGASSPVAPGDSTTTTSAAPTTTAPAATSTVPPAAPPSTTVAPTPLTDQSPPPPEPPEPDPSPQIRVSLVQLDLLAARRSQAEADAAAAQAHAQLDAARADQARADAAVADRTTAAEGARSRLGETAAVAYMHASGVDDGTVLDQDTSAPRRTRELLAVSIDLQSNRLAAADDAEGSARRDAQGARDVVDRASAAADAADQQAGAAAAATDAVRHDLAVATADARRPDAAGRWRLDLEGPSAFTGAELAQWYAAQGHGSQASVPIDQLAQLFVDEGAAEGVRGDMAFAQAIHETGWFANSDTVSRNNFAGIGHCDTCDGGFVFASAQDGVRAQVQLLKSYAEPTPTFANPMVDPRLHGPAGCCQAWIDLGGVWASDTGYGPRILARYRDMLQWLVLTRSEGAPA